VLDPFHDLTLDGSVATSVSPSRAHACSIRSACSLGESGSSPSRETRTTATARRKEGSMVEEGKPAPDFELVSDSGEPVTLSSLRGKRVILYFYPRDDTPGCTTQACGIRDDWRAFEERGAVVLGVSPDSEQSHAKFKGKYGLPFTLLADPDHALTEQYGFWVEKTIAGKRYMGVERSTVVIDADGNVANVFRRVKLTEHAQQVLTALD
jgi:thioredoxin-dependent peroxiredoxin